MDGRLARRSSTPLLGGDARGASAIEHVVLIALVALAAFGAWAAFGDAVDDEARCVAQRVMGASGTCGAAGASEAASRAEPGSVAAGHHAALTAAPGRARTFDSASGARAWLHSVLEAGVRVTPPGWWVAAFSGSILQSFAVEPR